MALAAATALLAGGPPVTAAESGDAARCAGLTAQGADAAELQPSSAGIPAACVARGRAGPKVRFELALPVAGWNGRFSHVDGQFAHIGCSGEACGPRLTLKGCAGLLRRGYACMVDDSAQAVTVVDPPADPQAAFEGPHLATVAGKALATRYYGAPPSRAYFLGCSNGGRQALIEAQAFPEDYDGIVAGAPVSDFGGNALAVLWNVSALVGDDGRSLFPAPDGGYLQPDLRLFHKALLARCDLNDGVQDGIIGDPRLCPFDPGQIECHGAKTPQCLTAGQVGAIRRILRGPVDSRGRRLFAGAALPGSEVNWGYSYLSPGDNDGPRQAMTRAQKPGAASVDWDHDFNALATVTAPVSPDLRRFKSRGGKLIVFHGWSDHEALPGGTLAYHRAVQERLGGASAAAEVLRLFMVPGMDHCGNGVSADKTDWLAALEAWVERGEAPDRVVVARLKDTRRWPADADYWAPPAWPAEKVEFTRPLFPYPAEARYRGFGDSTSADSFIEVFARPPATRSVSE